ncbi:MAG: chemotaxis protein CheW [Acidiferrobacterales bacterium]|nr:chemotaxis protein CheW [Acidiferrobacterales bacterium]
MSDANIECYVIPSLPLPILLPVECVAEVVNNPVVESLTKPPAVWMKGHVNWRNQRLPLVSFSALIDGNKKDTDRKQPSLVVLNPIPDAARKSYSGIICNGEVDKISVGKKLAFAEIPEELDKRYVETVVRVAKKQFIIPKLESLAVAFTYIS